MKKDKLKTLLEKREILYDKWQKSINPWTYKYVARKFNDEQQKLEDAEKKNRQNLWDLDKKIRQMMKEKTKEIR